MKIFYSGVKYPFYRKRAGASFEHKIDLLIKNQLLWQKCQPLPALRPKIILGIKSPGYIMK